MLAAIVAPADYCFLNAVASTLPLVCFAFVSTKFLCVGVPVRRRGHLGLRLPSRRSRKPRYIFALRQCFRGREAPLRPTRQPGGDFGPVIFESHPGSLRLPPGTSGDVRRADGRRYWPSLRRRRLWTRLLSRRRLDCLLKIQKALSERCGQKSFSPKALGLCPLRMG